MVEHSRNNSYQNQNCFNQCVLTYYWYVNKVFMLTDNYKPVDSLFMFSQIAVELFAELWKTISDILLSYISLVM